MIETEKFVPTHSRVFAKLERGKPKILEKITESVQGSICHVQY